MSSTKTIRPKMVDIPTVQFVKERQTGHGIIKISSVLENTGENFTVTIISATLVFVAEVISKCNII